MPYTVCLFGLSGVGKTTLAKRVVARVPNVSHVTASALLRSALDLSAEQLRTESAENVRSNQDVLVQAFWRVCGNLPVVLFDGHSLIDGEAGLIDVPLQTIIALKPAHVVFVHATVEEIVQRRASDAGRVRPARTPKQLSEQQPRAEKNARSYALAAGVPFVSTSADDDALVAEIFAAN
ncbi:MAG: hypothetical protein DCF16_17245 [Alphaproteobacteria bacterium]|nr:MAG: hypothetical protein DCF16_17245 [Alphaproteobacteria bacterium]